VEPIGACVFMADPGSYVRYGYVCFPQSPLRNTLPLLPLPLPSPQQCLPNNKDIALISDTDAGRDAQISRRRRAAEATWRPVVGAGIGKLLFGGGQMRPGELIMGLLAVSN
jgi:hypothetical protein